MVSGANDRNNTAMWSCNEPRCPLYLRDSPRGLGGLLLRWQHVRAGCTLQRRTPAQQAVASPFCLSVLAFMHGHGRILRLRRPAAQMNCASRHSPDNAAIIVGAGRAAMRVFHAGKPVLGRGVVRRFRNGFWAGRLPRFVTRRRRRLQSIALDLSVIWMAALIDMRSAGRSGCQQFGAFFI